MFVEVVVVEQFNLFVDKKVGFIEKKWVLGASFF